MIDVRTLANLSLLAESVSLECKLAGGMAAMSEQTSGKTSEKILALITISELALSIGVTERSIERNLKKLQETNLLSRIGPAKGGHWKASA
jgi:predicted HTH transcriptional regulator